MKYFRLNILFLYVTLIYGQNISRIYMDPNTKLFSGSNGVVIIELSNGIKSTICMNSVNNTLDAIVVCRSMNYTLGGVGALPIISSKKTSLAKTYLQKLSCNGSESSLDKCPGFKYTNPVDFKCQDNNQDLNVYCLNDYNFTNVTVNHGNCSPQNVFYGKHQLLTLKYNDQLIYFCGAKNQFSTNEAVLFCNLLCYSNYTNPRIIQGINITGSTDIPIGGFNNLSCLPNANSFDHCSYAHPYQSDGCTPKDNIGVECFISQDTADPLPNITCENNTLKLIWNLTLHPTIQSNDVSIQYSNVTCPQSKISNTTLFLFLNVSLNDCNDNAAGDPSNIIYTYQAKRTYQTVNGVQVKHDQLFEPKCFIPRNNTVVHGPFSIDPTSISGGTGPANIPVTLKLYRDSAFTQEVDSLKSIPIGSTVFVKVMMVNPPSKLVLVLVNCYVPSSSSTVYLIKIRCPAESSVQIIPISDSTSSFSFKSFNIPGQTNLKVICDTSKCGKAEIGCITTC